MAREERFNASDAEEDHNFESELRNGNADESNTDEFSSEPLLNSQCKYFIALCHQWVDLRQFHTLFCRKMLKVFHREGVEVSFHAELGNDDFLIEECQIIKTGTEVSPSDSINTQIDNLFALIEKTHYKSMDFAEMQSTSVSLTSPYKMPIINLHRLIARFKAKTASLFKVHDVQPRKKSSVMNCSCGRLLALSQRMIQFPKSYFQILSSFEYDPADIEGGSRHKKKRDCRTEVDLIQDDMAWFKFKEANKKKIQLIYEGMTESNNHKCVTTIADELLSAAKAHPFHFHTPTVFMEFLNGLTLEVAQELIERGIHVGVRSVSSHTTKQLIDKEMDAIIMLEYSLSTSPADEETEELAQILLNQKLSEEFMTKSSDTPQNCLFPPHTLDPASFYPKVVNLDVTSLIVLSADITHGYSSPDQATPSHKYHSQHSLIVPRLMRFLEGREWICTKQAKEDFDKILYTVGGEDEIQRAQDIFDKKILKVLDDCPSERFLKLTGLNKQHRNIFGTGDAMGAITLTSNQSLVNRIYQQGVFSSFYVFSNHSVRLGLRTEYYRNLLKKSEASVE